MGVGRKEKLEELWNAARELSVKPGNKRKHRKLEPPAISNEGIKRSDKSALNSSQEK